MKIYLGRIPKGYKGTLATLRYITDLIKKGAKDFCIRQKAIDIFIQCGIRPKDYGGEVHALFEWVRRNIRYTRDIYRVELLHSARRILELKAGDCDDMTILLGAMLMSTGHPVRLVVVGFRPEKPHAYSHIYPEVNIRDRWIPIDATVRYPMGWAPPAIWKRICEIPQEGVKCSTRTC
ncbi:MAG: transglutaminase domain-containing protein [Calditrichaceae bacterium]|nr:transglutaminase-like domain-containing protein [Calditrichia bacterium]NUQ40924.1 transglutaminase domain-containing protein [Calditrichaceae bacterium]